MQLQKSQTYINDLDIAISHSIGLESFKQSSFLITGTTGTIGSFLVDMLLRYNQINKVKISVCVAGRNLEELKIRYNFWNDNDITFVKYDINNSIEFEQSVDYIIHTAGNAHPTAFNNDPVGTIVGNVMSTYNLLEYGRTHKTKRLLYVSSGEIYGQGDLTLNEFDEKYVGCIDITSPRSCYPSSKRTAENLCASYSSQFDLETVIVRPCHTYGPSITPTDSRAHAQFIRNALNDKDIVMKSVGSQLRSYNYIADCASAILTVLANGKTGEAYNISNSAVSITIAEMAKVIANKAGKKVIFTNPTALDLANRTPIAKQVLSSKKIEALGWTGYYTIEEGISHTLDILQGK